MSGGQRTRLWETFSLSILWALAINSGRQAWQQAPFLLSRLAGPFSLFLPSEMNFGLLLFEPI